MSSTDITEYAMYLQLYKQYKLDCVAMGKVPKELVTFLGQFKAEARGSRDGKLSESSADSKQSETTLMAALVSPGPSALVSTFAKPAANYPTDTSTTSALTPKSENEAPNGQTNLNLAKRKLQHNEMKWIPTVKKRSLNISTFTLHVFVMPHLGWLGVRATGEEKCNLAEIHVAQRVVTFYFLHSENQHKNTILNAYGDISLEDFVAQRAVRNSKTLTSISDLTTEELKKGSGLLWCTSTTPLKFKAEIQFE